MKKLENNDKQSILEVLSPERTEELLLRGLKLEEFLRGLVRSGVGTTGLWVISGQAFVIEVTDWEKIKEEN